MSTDHAPTNAAARGRHHAHLSAHAPPDAIPRDSALPPPPQNPLLERRLLTVREAAERLGVSRDTVYRLLQSGALPSLTIGRARRISVWALDTFITKQEQVGAT